VATRGAKVRATKRRRSDDKAVDGSGLAAKERYCRKTGAIAYAGVLGPRDDGLQSGFASPFEAFEDPSAQPVKQ
jgi:hypothetical protein